MFFSDFNRLLLDHLRTRIRNGELTERGLATLIRISQPHMHNLLCGKRELNSVMADRILFHLRMSTLDLVESDSLRRYATAEPYDDHHLCFLPVLDGKLGPSHPWPGGVKEFQRHPISRMAIARMGHPVVVELAEDFRMHPLFGDGDWGLLDQSVSARTELDSTALYVVRRGRIGLVRRLRFLNRALYMIDEGSVDNPGAWERIPLDASVHVTHVVRARVTLLAGESSWTDRTVQA
ncbi:MAG TPA: hypothetical protein VES20_15180 [Bryobacteraceae bacterium]|nr:hypothetical protein [Bryobacteraceae bacterium]